MKRPGGVVQLDDVEFQGLDSGRMGLRCKRLGQAAGSRRLGCTYYEIPPGKRPCPYHWHEANEEAFYVLEGRGTLRLAGDTLPLEAGDYLACPPGEGSAHQIVNDSDAPLAYLAFSTMLQPEVAHYPDSGKVGVMAGTAPGGDVDGMQVFSFFDRGDAVAYHDGEED